MNQGRVRAGKETIKVRNVDKFEWFTWRHNQWRAPIFAFHFKTWRTANVLQCPQHFTNLRLDKTRRSPRPRRHVHHAVQRGAPPLSRREADAPVPKLLEGQTRHRETRHLLLLLASRTTSHAWGGTERQRLFSLIVRYCCKIADKTHTRPVK